MPQTNYERLIETYEKYSSWHKQGDSLLKAVGFSGTSNLSVYFRVFSQHGEQFQPIPLIPDLALLSYNSLETISIEEAARLLNQWGFKKEAQETLNPPNYIFNKATKSAQKKKSSYERKMDKWVKRMCSFQGPFKINCPHMSDPPNPSYNLDIDNAD